MYSQKQINKYKRKCLEYYAKVGVPFELGFVRNKGNLLIYRIKFVAGTTEDRIRGYLRDVAQMLKVQLFQLHWVGMDLFLIIARDKMIDNRLLRIIANPKYAEHTKDMQIPYTMGFDVMGRPVIVDFPDYIHWILGGSSNSGKTVGVKCLITGIIWSCSPGDVNLIIYDGASNLTEFDGVPHLSSSVIQDPETGFCAAMELYGEMERRIKLKNENIEEFNQLPFIVGVFDEFISLISSKKRELADIMSQILRRGRHARIHVVLAAQDPLIKDMKCDIGNASSRLAFTCTKLNYSMTILGESGAQNLSGDGEMYFKSNKHTGLIYVKGALISADEITTICSHICAKYESAEWDDSRKFRLNNKISGVPVLDAPTITPVMTEQEIENGLFTEIILWALKRKNVSALQLKEAFNMGWPRANAFIDRLYEIGIISAPHGKLPRNVLFTCIEDLPEDVIAFLDSLGHAAADGHTLIESTQSVHDLSIMEIASTFSKVSGAIKSVLEEVNNLNAKYQGATEDVSNFLIDVTKKLESCIQVISPNAKGDTHSHA